MKYLTILILFLFLFGCKSHPGDDDSPVDDSPVDDSPVDDSPVDEISLTVDLSGNSLVMIDSTELASNQTNTASKYMLAENSNCLTAADISGDVAESIISDPSLCITDLEKVDAYGGFLTWYDVSDDSIVYCGIINRDGTVWDTTGECPVQNGGFSNNNALHRISTYILHGLSETGDYVEYDQTNDKATVLITDASGDINHVTRIEHDNYMKYLYKINGMTKEKMNGEVKEIPELEDIHFHAIGTNLQYSIEGENKFRRAYFDNDGMITVGPAGVYIEYHSSPVPIALAEWINDSNSSGGPPSGPIINSSLNNCDSVTIDATGDATTDTTLIFCPNGYYKYTDSSSDIEIVDLCALGNCGRSDTSIMCTTSANIYFFTPFTRGELLTGLRLTKIDPVNEEWQQIFDIYSVNNSTNVTEEQIEDYKILSMGCDGSIVTALMSGRTILITNADDASPDVLYLPIVASSAI